MAEENEFKDELLEHDSFYSWATDEPYAPLKLSFKDICRYPFRTEFLFFTISIFGLNFFLTNLVLGLFFSIFLNILYGIYLIRKILDIKDANSSNAQLLLFFIYSFITNSVSWIVISIATDNFAKYFLPSTLYLILTNGADNGYLFLNILSPVISFVNIVFCSGFIITYTIGELRPFYTYLRYKKELSFYNFCSFCSLLFVFLLGLILININAENAKLITFVILMINLLSSYIILVTLISWTNFLRKDLYPEIYQSNSNELE